MLNFHEFDVLLETDQLITRLDRRAHLLWYRELAVTHLECQCPTPDTEKLTLERLMRNGTNSPIFTTWPSLNIGRGPSAPSPSPRRGSVLRAPFLFPRRAPRSAIMKERSKGALQTAALVRVLEYVTSHLRLTRQGGRKPGSATSSSYIRKNAVEGGVFWPMDSPPSRPSITPHCSHGHADAMLFMPPPPCAARDPHWGSPQKNEEGHRLVRNSRCYGCCCGWCGW